MAKAQAPVGKAPAGKAPAGKTPPPPAPLPTGAQAVKENPELIGQPAPTSPAGVTLDPNVPAPVPPLEANPVLPKEAQPAAQGSLTPAQVEQRKRDGNPAIAPAPLGRHANHVVIKDDVKRNEEGFIPGEEVNPDDVLAFERNRAAKEREEAARAAAKK